MLHIVCHRSLLLKAAATLGGIVRGNDRGIASVVWQVTLKYMGALIGRQRASAAVIAAITFL